MYIGRIAQTLKNLENWGCMYVIAHDTRAPDGANKKANTNTKTKTFREQCLRLIQRTCEHRYTQYISGT